MGIFFRQGVRTGIFRRYRDQQSRKSIPQRFFFWDKSIPIFPNPWGVILPSLFSLPSLQGIFQKIFNSVAKILAEKPIPQRNFSLKSSFRGSDLLNFSENHKNSTKLAKIVVFSVLSFVGFVGFERAPISGDRKQQKKSNSVAIESWKKVIPQR